MGRRLERSGQGEIEEERRAEQEAVMKAYRICLTLFAAMAALAVAGRVDPSHSTQEAPGMLTIRIAPERAEYLEQESIALSVEIENQGTESVEVPEPAFGSNSQPVYEITGPSFPKGNQFNNLSAARGRGEADSLAEPPIIKLPVGGKWSGGVLISQLLGELIPGEYSIRAAYSWQGKTAKSEEQRIRVKPVEPKSVHAGQGMRPLDRGEGRVVFLNRSDSSSSLVAFKFHETSPDIGEIAATSPIAQFTAGPQATDVGSPWTNGPFFEDLVQWTTWRDGRDIKAISDASTDALSLTLPADPLFLVRPPLKLKDRPIETLVVGGDRQLYLCTFPVDFDPKSPPKLVWHSRLPAQPSAAVAALAPHGNDSRHIAFVTANGPGVEIFHSSYRDSGSLAAFQSVHLPDVHLIANISPALMIDSSGAAHVTVIVSSKDGKSYSAVEAQFKNSGAPVGEPGVLSLGSLDQPVEGGAVLYVEKAGKLQKREIAILTPDPGRSAGSGLILRRWMPASGAWKVFAPHVTPVDPVILVPGQNYSYVLCYAQGQGFFFESL
jgi:hypothetical protein